MPAKIERTFRLVLGLSFLPERMRRWLFDKGTRAIEVLNATIFAIWGTVLLGDGGMVQTEHYKGFAVFEAVFGRKAWACAFLACAAFAVLGMLCDARRCKVLGGYALLLGALTWALLAMGCLLYCFIVENFYILDYKPKAEKEKVSVQHSLAEPEMEHH